MKVTLSKDYYPLSVVQEAAREYSQLAEIDVQQKGLRLEVTFDHIDEEVGSVLVDEFLNYALALSIANRG